MNNGNVVVVKDGNKVVISSPGKQGAPSTIPGPQGLQGVPGPQGPAGDSPQALGFVYYQSTPSNVWNIQHNLLFQPNVSVFDSAGSEVEGEVSYLDAHTIQIQFSSAFGGEAHLS